VTSGLPALLLYVTPGCGLCGPFRERLAAFAAARGVAVQVRDLLGEDAATRLRHRYDVPVLLAGGEVLARHRWDAAAEQAVEAWLTGHGHC
jgi:hypothetical protein